MLKVYRVMLIDALRAAVFCVDNEAPVFLGFVREPFKLAVVATDGIRMAVTEMSASLDFSRCNPETEFPDYVAMSRLLAERSARFLETLSGHYVGVSLWPSGSIQFEADGMLLNVETCCREKVPPPYAPTLQRFREHLDVSFATETECLTRAIRNGMRAVKQKAKANGIARAFCIVKLVLDNKARALFYLGADNEVAYCCELSRHDASGAGEILLDASKLDFLKAVEYETVNLSFSSEEGKAKPLLVEYGGVNVAVMGLLLPKTAKG